MKTSPTSTLAPVQAALSAASYSYTSGSTHNFYHYPARFSPDIARAVIETFSEADEWVMDPFMGGGTSIIEGLMLGRRMLGSDINALAKFVTEVRTTTLSATDESVIRAWATDCAVRFGRGNPGDVDAPGIHNLPAAVETFMSCALRNADRLPFPRQQAFARCALLRLGQWALDCRDFVAPRRRMLGDKLPELADQMLAGLDEFVEACRASGVAKNGIANRRLLLHKNASELYEDRRATELRPRPRLVFTSPPYPSVHVLYHRWQYRGRKETPAPYWIARVPDGFYASYYTGGSRTPLGRERYFTMIESAFRSIRRVLSSRGLVVQLVGFSEAGTQLPRYLSAMTAAGYDEWEPASADLGRLERRVPNRKWYAKLQGSLDASTEILLFHRPRPS